MDKSTFDAFVASEDLCRKYIYELRWPNEHRCPHCNYGLVWHTKEDKFKCPSCEKKSSLTSGTIFHKTRLPLTSWFRAMWYVSSVSTNGKFSAKELQKVLGAGSNRTALAVLDKLKQAMYRPLLRKLNGVVEVATKPINTADKNMALAVAVEIIGRKTGSIRARIIDKASTQQFATFIEECVETGAELVDEHGFIGFEQLEEKGYIFKVPFLTYEYRRSEDVARRIGLLLDSSIDIETAAQRVDRYCMEVNSLKIPISFEELARNAVKLPPSPKSKKELYL